METHRRREKTCITEFFFKCDFHVFLLGARTHHFAKYFDIFKMKSKFLTKLKDWNGNAQAQEKKTCITEFFSSVIFMRFCAAKERTILLNTLIFFKENPNF